MEEAPAGVKAVQLIATEAQPRLPVRDNCFGKKIFKMCSRHVRSFGLDLDAAVSASAALPAPEGTTE
jgi:hypothetical protein